MASHENKEYFDKISVCGFRFWANFFGGFAVLDDFFFGFAVSNTPQCPPQVALHETLCKCPSEGHKHGGRKICR